MTKAATLIKGHPRLWLFLALTIFRLCNALLIQTQFDPDEYWQTLEPAYCNVFAPCETTWEWTRRHADPGNATLVQQSLHGPVRSYLSVIPTYLFYKIVQYLNWDNSAWIIAKGPMLVHAILVAAPTDYAVYAIATTLGYDNQCALLLSVGAWFHGYALIRTYSNSIETMLLLVGVALLIVPSSEGSKTTTTTITSTTFTRLDKLAYLLGGFSVAIRFTSVAAWGPLGFFLAFKKKRPIYYLLQPCALFGVLGIATSVLIDKTFFGIWVLPALGNFHFNVLLGHGSLYGTHAWHWYVTAGLPAICGLLLPLLFMSIVRQTGSALLWIIIGCYVALHSCSSHKEFRFLLPILPLCCIQATSVVPTCPNYNQRRRQRFFGIMYMLINGMVVFYLGRIHQAGPIALQRGLVELQLRNQQQGASVHYWMGCHATPLYSHLHGSNLTATYLTCPPSCRVEGNCDADVFHQDPKGFVQSRYLIDHNSTCGDTPDYIAMMSSTTDVLLEELELMNMVEVARYAHSWTGIRIGSIVFGESPLVRGSGWGMVAVNELVLYAKKDTITGGSR